MLIYDRSHFYILCLLLCRLDYLNLIGGSTNETRHHKKSFEFNDEICTVSSC